MLYLAQEVQVMDKKAHLKMQGMALREIRESKTNYKYQ